MITPAQVASRMGWSTRRARRRLQAAGALEKRAGRHATTIARLVDRFPEIAERFGPCAPPSGVPALLEARDVARMTGRETRWARRWLLREGAGEKRGGRVVTTAQRARDVFGGAGDGE
jgi:hypothetical protein